VYPVDGTREFLSRNDEFTVNVALIINRRPVLGVVFAPALKTLYAGIVGQGATRAIDDAPPEAIKVRTPPEEGLTVVASRHHGDPEVLKKFLAGRPLGAMKNAGSSLKFCLVAAGEADLYPRFGRTMEWDTAAGQAVLEAAGGTVTTEDGALFAYAKNAIFENPNFIAWGGLDPAGILDG
jgi:3'(2'), 5'-bisphosphate nucleotidase